MNNKKNEETSPDQILVSKEISTFIVEELLYDYFKIDSESAIQKRKERLAKRREKIKNKSRERDNAINKTQREIHEALAQICEKEHNGEIVNEEEFFKKFPHISKNDQNICAFRYHLPVISSHPVNEEGDCEYDCNHDCRSYDDIIEQIVYKTMLRSIFETFYEFDEISFRRDLAERASLINPGVEPTEFGEGYSELTMMLENPLIYYAFPKEYPKEKTTKRPFCILDPNTEKRLKQYADEHEIPVSKAIQDWIWSQPLKNDKKTNNINSITAIPRTCTKQALF